MSKVNPKYQTGFRLASTLDADGIIWYPVEEAENIAIGDVVSLVSGEGYAEDGATSFAGGATRTLGIAAANADNTSGSDGDISVPVIPFRPHYRFWAPVGNDAIVSQADVGLMFDLHADNSLDSADTTCLYYGFLVEAIDISTAAVATNAYGYVLGRILTTPDEA